jgi:peptidoglycan L-alanyl-D-glutamate endopeptidase CwlK
MDKITLERIQLLHPKVREEAGEIYAEICQALTGRAMCRFGFTLRTIAEQNKLYAQGRTAPGKIVTNAKGGLSYHNYGLAIDIVLIVDTNGDGKYDTASWDVKSDFDGDGRSDWVEVVQIFKSHGWEAGIDWKFYDAPHFQKTFGYSVRQLYAMHQAGNVTPNGYVRI